MEVKFKFNEGEDVESILRIILQDFGPKLNMGISGATLKLNLCKAEEKEPRSEENKKDEEKLSTENEKIEPKVIAMAGIEESVDKISETAVIEECNKEVFEKDIRNEEPKNTGGFKEESQEVENASSNEEHEIVQEEDSNIARDIIMNIAKEEKSFEDFVEKLRLFLNIKAHTEFFKALMYSSAEVEKINWRNIEMDLGKKGVFYTNYDKIYCGKRISESNLGIKILPFLKLMREVKEYFNQKEISIDSSNVENNVDADVEVHCMRGIEEFENALKNMSNSLSIDFRCKSILPMLGIKEKNHYEQEQIQEIVTTAMREEWYDKDSLMEKTKIPESERCFAYMMFSNMVNDFIQKHYPIRVIKLIDFLKELKEALNK